MDAGEPYTLKEEMTRPNGNLQKMSEISEVNNCLSRKAYIPTKRSIVISKVRKPAPINCIFNSKEEPGRLINLKSRNVVKGYMQVPGVDSTKSLLPVASDTSTRILIDMNYVWVAEVYDVESSSLHPNMEVEMFIEWHEVIVDLGITTKEFMEEYCILIGNSMYGNVDAVILWLIMLAKYLINSFKLKGGRQTNVFL